MFYYTRNVLNLCNTIRCVFLKTAGEDRDKMRCYKLNKTIKTTTSASLCLIQAVDETWYEIIHHFDNII